MRHSLRRASTECGHGVCGWEAGAFLALFRVGRVKKDTVGPPSAQAAEQEMASRTGTSHGVAPGGDTLQLVLAWMRTARTYV